MASMPYKDIISSPPFTFVVGQDEKEHTLHSALVAGQSSALNALINGGMKESIERRVIWKEIDEAVFIRFGQYVYTGNYDEATPRKRKTPEGMPAAQATHVINAGLRPKKGVMPARGGGGGFFSNSIKKGMLWDKFQALYPLPQSGAPPSGESSAKYDYSDVFLGHARMYIFADYYGIDPLQTLALSKLRRALTALTLGVESHGDIFQLIRYTFEQTVDKGGQGDKLRSLVCLYAACKVEDLWRDAEFEDLTKALPDFAIGLISSMLERLD
ncbi:hypothetical protein ACQKWADRAFT_304499 [Trichoderma austrokoningii]